MINMSAYIVRLIDTDELVGFLIADTTKDLFWAIDELLNPHECEYKRITGGGIFWGESGAGEVYSTIPVEDFEECFEPLPLDGASLAQWTQQEYEDERPWKRFKADAGYTKTGEGA
jgi:hypothetical protein